MGPISIVFEHQDFLVINKPCGISVHRDELSQGLIDILKLQTGVDSLYLVHRLDKPTSGLLLLAKHQQSASSLSQLFQKRDIKKYYLAISSHKPSKKQGIVIGDMEKSRRGAWKLTRTKNNPAKTRFLTFPLEGIGRLYLVRPYTGKTHQIRVALKSICAPILGDELYGSIEKEKLVADRCYLHAYALRFTYLDVPFEFHCLPECGAYFQHPAFLSLLELIKEPSSLKWGNR